ncbi:DMT family transporter [Oceanospirillum beijerinckii]|uniref:DMT family transporter n=1 Tax=Oceanospirillum beijerinckii TaxID=64976 RepID=UPI000404DA66|nr:DMT family transporter [Oceanospirillum beijerinckii]
MVIRSHRAALLILSAVSFVWGAEFVLIDMAVEQMPVHTFNAFRFTLAGLSLIPLLILSKELIRPDQFWPLLQKGAILGFMLFVGFYAQTEGLRHTSVSNAGFITGLNVPLVPVLGFLIFRTKVARTVWLSVLLATVGLYMLTMGDKLEFNKGDLMVLVCAFAFAIHIVMTGRYVDHLPVVALSVVQLLAVGFYSIAGAVLSSEPAFYYLEAQPMTWVDQLIDPLIIAAILVAGLLGTAFAYWGQSACQKILPDYKVALVFATEPVFAYITAWLVLSETLGFIGILGAIGIIAGMLVAELGDRRHPLEVQVLDQTVAPK